MANRQISTTILVEPTFNGVWSAAQLYLSTAHAAILVCHLGRRHTANCASCNFWVQAAYLQTTTSPLPLLHYKLMLVIHCRGDCGTFNRSKSYIQFDASAKQPGHALKQHVKCNGCCRFFRRTSVHGSLRPSRERTARESRWQESLMLNQGFINPCFPSHVNLPVAFRARSLGAMSLVMTSSGSCQGGLWDMSLGPDRISGTCPLNHSRDLSGSSLLVHCERLRESHWVQVRSQEQVTGTRMSWNIWPSTRRLKSVKRYESRESDLVGGSIYIYIHIQPAKDLSYHFVG